jgi:3-isopropylmalate/(R)-2-methylmalate dehydratase large subunit
MRKPKTMAINVNGKLNQGVTPKDVILHIISLIGIGGGTGYAIEYRGNVFEDMSMDGRMTVCNMSIEAGARCGMIAPDEVTFEFLKGRKYTPKNYEDSCAEWLSLSTDEGAVFDKEVNIKAASIKPMVTYGTHPGMGIPIDSIVPKSSNLAEQASFDYMQIKEGDKMLGMKVDKVFIGSCTNSRMDDLRAAASIFKKKKIAPHVKALVVPGSAQVKAIAEKEGLDKIFKDAGADWREPGCSMCLGMNGDIGLPGELIVSTSNRNFIGRQGPGVRTILASPETAASTAVAGVIEDPRNLKNNK